ncbi:MAG: hypothetical protein GY719_14640 [bacterium]|nr:hypothetical protein [bacterium]
MTTQPQITDAAADVNARLADLLEERVSELFTRTDLTGRELEMAVWSVVLEVGRVLLTALLSVACWRVTRRVTGGRPVQLRLDRNYFLSQSTTFGTVTAPLFAYREGGRTLSPARQEVFPLHPKCRSSVLLLEWEARVGSQLPFRQAEDAMEFFSHGAVRTEDTTISRHMGVIGALVDRQWTCREPAKVAEILAERATRDKQSGKPLLYVSTDAHALRRYVDDTWKAEYKMINGIRLWSIDRRTGQTIHIGGEYTWGDCRDVAERVRALLALLVPTGEDAPQLVLVTDGMPWIRDHVFPVMPEGTRFVLDFYHLVERLSAYAAARFGAKTKQARAWVRRMTARLTGKRPYKRRKLAKRKGHRKNRRRPRDPYRTVHACEHPHGAGDDVLWTLIEQEPASDALDALVGYVAANLDRIDYSTYRAHGMQIGSGAMESLHRVASQMRLKLAGARWTAERALAVLNTRLMMLAQRWDDFWSHADLPATLAQAFHSPTTSAEAA